MQPVSNSAGAQQKPSAAGRARPPEPGVGMCPAAGAKHRGAEEGQLQRQPEASSANTRAKEEFIAVENKGELRPERREITNHLMQVWSPGRASELNQTLVCYQMQTATFTFSKRNISPFM